jgi:uncharacterized damage-inducible protein DinB
MNLLVDRMFRHMAWANEYVFDRLAELSPQELALTAPHDVWTTAEILEHLTASRYADLLDGLGEIETAVPKNSAEVLALKELSQSFDARLRAASDLVEGFVEFQRGDRLIRRSRQTILAQAIHHADEHRAQIAGIFSSHGMNVVDLDAIDLWEFANFEGLGD